MNCKSLLPNALAAALTLLFTVSAGQLFATDYTVNNSADANTGSGTTGTLRYCIAQANLTAGPHTITFAPGITTVFFSSDYPQINRQMTIDGGPNRVIVQFSGAAGDHSIRPFYLIAGSSGSTLRNLDVRNSGLEPVRIDGSPTNITIRNFRCSNSAGGLWNFGVLVGNNANGLIIDNCQFNNVQSVAGWGGIHISGSATNVTIDSVLVSRAAGAVGEGIYIVGTSNNVSITNSRIFQADRGFRFDGNCTGLTATNDTLQSIRHEGMRFVTASLTTANLTNIRMPNYSGSASGVAEFMRVDGITSNLTASNIFIDLNLTATTDDGDYGFVFAGNASNVNFTNVTALDCEIRPIHFGGTVTTGSFTNCTFDNSNGVGNYDAMLYFGSTVSSLTMNNVLINCDLLGSTVDHDDGIRFIGAVSNSTLTNVRIREADRFGIHFATSATNVNITASQLIKNGHGILFSEAGTRTMDITQTRIDSSTTYGIEYRSMTVSDAIDFTTDTITNSGNDGIWIRWTETDANHNITNCVIAGNGRTQTNGDGIQINYVDGVIITNNSVYDNAGLGINLTTTGNCTNDGKAPVINSVTPNGGGSYTVNFTIPATADDNTPGGTFTVHFYTNSAFAGAEGEHFAYTQAGFAVGTHNVTFTTNTGPAANPSLASLTMTYTAVGSSACTGTSEFSNALGLDPRGPACVNANILAWYRADKITGYTNNQPMSELLDQSGNGFKFKQYVAAEQPKYFAGDVTTNFNPSILFDGAGDNFEYTGGLFPANTNGGTFFATLYHANVAADWGVIFDQTVDDPSLFKVTGSGQVRFFDNGNNATNLGNRLLQNNVTALRGFDYGTAANTTNVFFDGILSANLGGTASPVVNTTSYFGGRNTSWPWNGKIHELIFYNRELTAAERQRINSYLSIKWGFSVDTTIMKVADAGNNYLASDGSTVVWTANSTHYHRVTGIGRDDCTELMQKQSRNVNTTNAGVLTLGLGTIAANNPANNATFGADKSFLVWADDGKTGTTSTAITGDGSISLSGGVCSQYARLRKSWRVEETGTVGNVQLSLDMTGVKVGKTAGDYFLAIHTSDNFTGQITQLVPAASYNNATGILVFNNVNFPAGVRYFTVIGKRVYGPANITTNLRVWLKAEDGIVDPTQGASVDLWADQGPAARDATQNTAANRPTYNATSNLINFNPTLGFNGTNQWLSTSSIFGTGSITYTTFGVVRNTAISGTDYWLFDGNPVCGTAVGFAHVGSALYNINFCNDLITPNAVAANTAYFEGFTRNGSTFVRNNFLNGKNVGTNTVAGLNKVNNVGVVGARNGGEYWGGQIGEIIAFESELPAADRQKVDTYLGIKWGITLDQTTPYNYVAADGTVIWDATANATYKHRITGIGRDDCSDLLQRQSRNQDTLTAYATMGLGTIAATNIANTNNFSADKNFLLWGDDNLPGASSTSITGDGTITLTAGDCGTYRRLAKTWRVAETGTVGNVQVQINFRGVVLASSASELYLAIHSSSTFTGTITQLVPAASLANGVATFNNVNFTDGQYFTVIGRRVYGPANLTTNLKLWLRADRGIDENDPVVDQWNDHGPGGADASQATAANRPAYNKTTNLVNFNRTVGFNGTANWLRTPANIFPSGNIGYTVFGIVNHDNLAGNRYYLWDGGVTTNTAAFFGHQGALQAQGNWLNDLPAGPVVVGTPYLQGFTRDGSSNVKANFQSARQVGTNTLGAINKSNNGFTSIGSNTVNTELFFGKVGEIIAYDGVLPVADQQKIYTYLAVKWGFTLDQTSPYNYVAGDGTVIWNATTYGSFSNRITGIGRDDCSDLLQKQSKSVEAGSLVTLSNGTSRSASNDDNTSTFSANNSWLLFGDNNQAITWTGSGVPANGGNMRLNRVWRVTETGTVGTVYLEVPDNTSSAATKLPVATATVYLFVANSSTNGSFSANSGVTIQPMTFDAANKTWSTTYNFANGDYFTFGSERSCIAPAGISEGLTAWYSATNLGTGTIPASSGTLSDVAFSAYPLTRNAAGTATVLAGSATSYNYNRSISLTGNAAFTRSLSTVNDVFSAAAGSVFGVATTSPSLFGVSNSASNVSGLSTNAVFNGTTSAFGTSSATVPNIFGMVGSTTNVTCYLNGAAGVASGSIAARAAGTYTLGLGQNGSNLTYHNGSFAEIFTYNRVLTAAERDVLESYLAIKYGQTLSHNYFNGDYDGTNAAATTIYDVSTYGNRVFGIGNDTTGCFYQKQSTSALSGALLKLGIGSAFAAENSGNTATFTTDRSYVVAGDNDGGIGAWVTGGGANPPTPALYNSTCEQPQRLARQWKVKGTYANPTVLFAMPDATSTDPTKLPAVPSGYSVWMVVNDNADFSVNANQTELAMTLNNTTKQWEATYNVPANATKYIAFVIKNNNIATGATAPAVTIAVDENSCVPDDGNITSGSQVILTPTTGAAYAWSTMATSGAITVNPTSTTTYTVTVTASNGCTGTASTTITIVPNPVVGIVATENSCTPNDNKVLSGQLVNLTASGGGTYLWDDNSTNAIRLVNPIATSTYTVTVTDPGGCTGTASVTITVVTAPAASITGVSNICVGATTALAPTSGGTWTSNAPSVATVDNAGLVTGVSAGIATFIFTESTNGCASAATAPVTVNGIPAVSITGASNICVGATTALSPTTGGSWASSNPAVATVAGDGVVTAVSAGNATFTFTNTTTGCVSAPTSAVTVTALPVVNITGATTICSGSTTTLTPTTGGTWTSSNPGVATVTNAGVVTGVATGTATFTFTSSTAPNCTATTGTVTVNSRPAVSVTGASMVCVGSTTTLEPTTGGTWVSSNPAVATVTSAGVVTGVSAGNATFTFTEGATGCASLPTPLVQIIARPVVSITGATNICVGGTTALSPTTGGTWTSSNPGVATVTNAGVVTGVAAGSVTFTFTDDNTGCTSLATGSVTVNALPIVSISGVNTICVGTTTTLSPTTGGTWTSSNPAVATVTNAGVVTGVAAGSATFTFTSSTAPNCSSTTGAVTVQALPTVGNSGNATICVGSTTTLTPTSGGTWTSNTPAVATITNAGVVTGVAAGTATFSFTESATGCVSPGPASTVTVNALPTVSITGASAICVGATTMLSPTTGGTWTSSNPAVATVTNAGVVTAVSAGTVTFTFTNSLTNCTSAPTAPVTVNPLPTVSITGLASICIGATTGLAPITGGTWASSNPAVATVANDGVVTGVSAGNATFTFTNSTTGCVSPATSAVTVQPTPAVSITGASSICIGATTTLAPGTGGTWVSSNPAVATITNAGVVTGVSAGTATFTFTNGATGCVSAASPVVTVNALPTASITGTSSICVGTTTILAPTSGGTWTSSDPAVATVANNGTVTGVSAGLATFTFTNSTTGCVSAPTTPVTVNPTPVVNISGPSTLCIGFTTGLSPSTGGTWASSNAAVATVTPAGVVTAVSAGTATFTFTNTATGCVSAPTGTVTVNPTPAVSVTGALNICIGGTTTLSPTTGGTWVSTNPGVATVTNAGVVTGVSAGTVDFIFTNSSTGCVSAATPTVTVNATPIASLIGAASICVGATTTLSPSTGGTWTSSNPAVATVTNAGVVTGVAAGTATFTFTDGTTGCVSAPTSAVTVNSAPVASITGATTLCAGATTTLSPGSGGTWVSSNPAVATVTNAGLVTAISAGTATFTFTNNATGCVSAPTGTVTVNALPAVSIAGANSICVGGTTTLSPASGGTWTSTNPAIATVMNTGVVTGVSAGTVNFTFTSALTGCTSPATPAITVNALPVASITGATAVCVGSTTQLSPTSGGTWVSSNPTVATVSPVGVVTAVSPGTATFTFTNTATGCVSAPTPAVTVNSLPLAFITGSSSICIGGTTTLSPTTGGTWTSSNPAVATVTNGGIVTGVAAGTVTFTFTNTTTGCVSAPSATVTVNAGPTASIAGADNVCIGATTQLSPGTGGTWISSAPAIATVTNTGVVTGVTAGTATFTFTSSLTGCVSAPTPAVTVNGRPVVSISGASTICAGSTTTLSPTTGGTWTSSNPAVATVSPAGVVTGVGGGTVTFTFTNTSTGCVSLPTAAITVNALPVATITGAANICIGSTTTLSPTSGGTWTSSNPAVATVTNAGVVTGLSVGTVTFTFTSSSTGCVSQPTATVTVAACNTLLAARVFLGGAYNTGTDRMNDNLRTAGLIPSGQPYGGSQYTDFNYTGTETIGAGVLTTSGDDAIVDWVLLELRNAASPGTIVARKAALVQRDGDVVEAADGVSPVTFVGTTAGSFYVAVKHRNHLGVMTANPVALSGATAVSVNFTSAATANYQLPGANGTPHAQKELPNGKRALWDGNLGGENGTGNQIRFQGTDADTDEPYYSVLLAPGNVGIVPNYIVTAYDRADGNLDGMVIYQGGSSDSDVPFFVVFTYPANGLFLPNYVIYQQIP